MWVLRVFYLSLPFARIIQNQYITNLGFRIRDTFFFSFISNSSPHIQLIFKANVLIPVFMLFKWEESGWWTLPQRLLSFDVGVWCRHSRVRIPRILWVVCWETGWTHSAVLPTKCTHELAPTSLATRTYTSCSLVYILIFWVISKSSYHFFRVISIFLSTRG